jgi:hypothetical protein
MTRGQRSEGGGVCVDWHSRAYLAGPTAGEMWMDYPQLARGDFGINAGEIAVIPTFPITTSETGSLFLLNTQRMWES